VNPLWVDGIPPNPLPKRGLLLDEAVWNYCERLNTSTLMEGVGVSSIGLCAYHPSLLEAREVAEVGLNAGWLLSGVARHARVGSQRRRTE
jgi:hypothetical protein